MRLSEGKTYRSDIFDKGNDRAEVHKSHENKPEVIYVIHRGLQDYLDDLPEISFDERESGHEDQKRTFLTVLEKRLQESIKNGKTEKISVLDTGCGRGDFLIELSHYLADKFFDGNISKFREKVSIVGLTIADLRDHYMIQKKLPSTREQIDHLGIKYIIADMRHLAEELKKHGDNQFDCIVSNHAINYVNPARMRREVIKDIYRALKPGGVAAMNYTGLLTEDSDYSFLKEACQEACSSIARHLEKCASEKGVKIQFSDMGSVSLEKDSPFFHLPIEYTKSGDQKDVLKWLTELQGGVFPELTAQTITLFKEAYYSAFYELAVAVPLDQETIEFYKNDDVPKVKVVLPMFFKRFVDEGLNSWVNSNKSMKQRHASLPSELLDKMVNKFFSFE